MGGDILKYRPQKKFRKKHVSLVQIYFFLAPFHLFLPFWVHCRPDLMQKHNFLPFQVQCGGLFYLFLMGATLLFSSAPPNLGSESESPNPKPNSKKGRASNLLSGPEKLGSTFNHLQLSVDNGI